MWVRIITFRIEQKSEEKKKWIWDILIVIGIVVVVFDEATVVVLVDVLFVWAGEETCKGGDEEEVDMLCVCEAKLFVFAKWKTSNTFFEISL